MLKKILPLLIALLVTPNFCIAETILTPQSIENEVIHIEKPNQAYTLLNGIRKDRNTIYNVLNLTPAQKCKTREIEKERFEEITPLINQLLVKKKELKTLKSENANKIQIYTLEKEINSLIKQIKHISNKHDKNFEKLLTKEQKNKYNMVQKLRRDDFKKLDKIDKFGEKNSDLRPFGYDINQAEYLENLNNENKLKTKCKNFFKRK